MANVTQTEPVILVGDHGEKAAGLSKKGIPCIVFPTQALAEKWRGQLNAINAAEDHKLRISNYELAMSLIAEREEKIGALVTSLLGQIQPEDEDNPPDELNYTAWRLAQLLDDMISSTGPREVVRRHLMNGLQYV